jgi:rubrerythrin
MRQREMESAKIDRGDPSVLECRHCGWYWRAKRKGTEPEFCPNCQRRKWKAG